MKDYCNSKDNKRANQMAIDIMRSIIIITLLASAVIGFYDLRRDIHDIKKQIDENTETILFESGSDKTNSENTEVSK